MKSQLKHILIILSISILFFSCEDPIPNDYTEIILVEGLLIVDKPIEQVKLTRTLPLTELYYYGNALINNAKVYIYEDDNEMELRFRRFDSANIKKSGYYYSNNNYKVKPNTKYKLKIILNNGTEITGETTTPNRIKWIKQIDTIVPYPDDTINLPAFAGGQTEWTKSDNENAFYIYATTCLDTIGYGKYLNPQTIDTNCRIRKRNHQNDDNETTRLAPDLTINSVSILSKSSFNWNFCRWFGKHTLKIYAPDKNYEKWFTYYLMSQNFDDKSFSVKGASGYFGSASMIEDNFFLQKNKYN